MAYDKAIRDLPFKMMPDSVIAEARKRCMLKRYIRRHGLSVDNDTNTETLQYLVRSIRDRTKIPDAEDGGEKMVQKAFVACYDLGKNPDLVTVTCKTPTTHSAIKKWLRDLGYQPPMMVYDNKSHLFKQFETIFSWEDAEELP